jgi:hypothetical protein
MQFKIGDKVRFLNEKGEGVISGFVNKTTVNVHIEEGFDIPYPVNELVSIHEDKPKTQETVAITVPVNEPTAIIKDIIPVNSNFSKGVYLLFVPESGNILESPLQLAITNYTEYDVLYTLSTKRAEGYVTISTGDIGSGKNNNILLISRSEIERFTHVKIDLVYYSNAAHKPQPPVSEMIRINPVRFYKENNFVKTPFLPKRAFVAVIAGLDDEKNWENVEIDPDQLARAMKQKRSSDPVKLSKPHQLNDPEIEIDLHIEELIESHAGMNNAQIIDQQLKHFKRELEKAIDSNVKKITFIHGVGIGRLKQEIHSVLKTYDHIRFHDAPYSKYGFGATEVVLR